MGRSGYAVLIRWLNETIGHLMQIKSPNWYLQLPLILFWGNWCHYRVGVGGGRRGGGRRGDRHCRCCKKDRPGYTPLACSLPTALNMTESGVWEAWASLP